jgi:N-carbamoylputrescine amidase
MRALARELGVVLPVSYFERAGQAVFNSVAIVDADGSIVGTYRKSHIPDGPGYQEKFYFSPGDTGFRVFKTRHATIGVGICWDQWFPETARCLALQVSRGFGMGEGGGGRRFWVGGLRAKAERTRRTRTFSLASSLRARPPTNANHQNQKTKKTHKQGAEVIFYPTAIGSEPHDPTVTSYRHWARTMLGHAAANLTPVVASNRVGRETFSGPPASEITFYGGSFVGGQEGEVVAQVGAAPGANADGAIDPNPDKGAEGFCLATFDLDACAAKRAGWGVFRDRRPELYGPLASLDGVNVHRAVERGASGAGLLVTNAGVGAGEEGAGGGARKLAANGR